MDKATFLGTTDYYLRPKLRNAAELHSWAWRGVGPMNGQRHRLQTTTNIIAGQHAKVIVETGTYRALTTKFLAGFGVHVHTVEIDPRLHAYCAARLRHTRNVTLHHGSSPEVLWRLANDDSVPKDRAFFYLDAHWDQHIPLTDELAMIRRYWSESVVMVDDFAVPGDSYRWLDRGPGACLDETSLGAWWNDKRRWYPQCPAHQEVGQNTGYVVLAQDDAAAEVLDEVSGLRRGPHVYQSVLSETAVRDTS